MIQNKKAIVSCCSDCLCCLPLQTTLSTSCKKYPPCTISLPVVVWPPFHFIFTNHSTINIHQFCSILYRLASIFQIHIDNMISSCNHILWEPIFPPHLSTLRCVHLSCSSPTDATSEPSWHCWRQTCSDRLLFNSSPHWIAYTVHYHI